MPMLSVAPVHVATRRPLPVAVRLICRLMGLCSRGVALIAMRAGSVSPAASAGASLTRVTCARQVDAAPCTTSPCWTSDIRNQPMVAYHLNMEYLLAEAYSCWSSGVGIPASLRGGGPPSIGCQKLNFQDPFVAVRCSFPRLAIVPCDTEHPLRSKVALPGPPHFERNSSERQHSRRRHTLLASCLNLRLG